MNLFGHRHHRCDDPWEQAPPWAIELREMLSLVLRKEDMIMTIESDALDKAEAAAKANSDADDAAEKLLISISAMVADLKNHQTDPATATRIQALADALGQRSAQLSAAVVANTPAA